MSSLSSALLTDLYQLTMLQAYFDEGMDEPAVFEFYVRELPRGRNFLLFAGLEPALDYLEHLHFSGEELAWLAAQGRFRPAFLDWLGALRFRGDVLAMAEGTPFFANEPVLRVQASIAQAQLVESRIINLLHYQILVASKAARCVLAAPGKLLVDFGLRRAHGGEAGLLAARASYLAGFDGTATVLAGQRYGIPLYGTMAHSYILSHRREAEAFQCFARSYGSGVVLLIDTYDSVQAAHAVAELAARGVEIKAVRLDSGDLAAEAQVVRKVLDAAGFPKVGIFASGNLDENELQRLLEQGAPIDGFGVGTRLNTSDDAPFLDCAYKLQVFAGQPRRKRSSGKANWPGAKQVFRHWDGHGYAAGDLVALEDERPAGTPLLKPVMRTGRRLAQPSLAELRANTRSAIAQLPPALRSLQPGPAYPVEFSEKLLRLAAQLDSEAH